MYLNKDGKMGVIYNAYYTAGFSTMLDDSNIETNEIIIKAIIDANDAREQFFKDNNLTVFEKQCLSDSVKVINGMTASEYIDTAIINECTDDVCRIINGLDLRIKFIDPTSPYKINECDGLENITALLPINDFINKDGVFEGTRYMLNVLPLVGYTNINIPLNDKNLIKAITFDGK